MNWYIVKGGVLRSMIYYVFYFDEKLFDILLKKVGIFNIIYYLFIREIRYLNLCYNWNKLVDKKEYVKSSLMFMLIKVDINFKRYWIFMCFEWMVYWIWKIEEYIMFVI